MLRTLAAAAIIIAGTPACRVEGHPSGMSPFRGETLHGEHLLAPATLTAHYVDAALRAGASTQEINDVLALVVNTTVIDEFRVSDHNGRVAGANVSGTDFTFPTDPGPGHPRAAPLAALPTCGRRAITQDFLPQDYLPQDFLPLRGGSTLRGRDEHQHRRNPIAPDDPQGAAKDT